MCVCVCVHAFWVRTCVYVRACVVAESDPRRGRGVCCDAVHVAKLFTGISTGKTSSLTLSVQAVSSFFSVQNLAQWKKSRAPQTLVYFKLKPLWLQSHIFTAHPRLQLCCLMSSDVGWHIRDNHPRLRTAVLNIHVHNCSWVQLHSTWIYIYIYILREECFASLRSLHDFVFEKLWLRCLN